MAISACSSARWRTRLRMDPASGKPPKMPFSTRITSAKNLESYFRPSGTTSRPCTEVVFSDARQKKEGVNTMDIAKRLIDLRDSNR